MFTYYDCARSSKLVHTIPSSSTRFADSDTASILRTCRQPTTTLRAGDLCSGPRRRSIVSSQPTAPALDRGVRSGYVQLALSTAPSYRSPRSPSRVEPLSFQVGPLADP